MHFFSLAENLEEDSEDEHLEQLEQLEQPEVDDPVIENELKEKTSEEIIAEMKSGEITYRGEIFNGFVFGLFVGLINIIVAIILWLTLSIYWFPILDIILLLQASMFFLMAGVVGWFGPSVSLKLVAEHFFKTTLDKAPPVTYLKTMLKYCMTALTLIFEAIIFGQFYYALV